MTRFSVTVSRTAVLLAMLPLSACAADGKLGRFGSPAADVSFGQTVSHNILAQTVNTDPRYAGVLLEGGSGPRGADAFKRYRTGTVKALLKSNSKANVGEQGGASAQDSASGTATPQ